MPQAMAARIIDEIVARRANGANNRYEGAVWWTTARSYLPGYVRDARFDANQATRHELVRKITYFEANSALVNRLADVFEQYTVGANGLQLTPATSDEDWNQRAGDWWATWQRFPELTSRANFGTVQGLAARQWFIPGETFILLTRGDSGRPRVQLIEPHRIYTPGQLAMNEGETVIDGVQIDPNGRPIGYYLPEPDGAGFRLIPAENMVHIFEPSRPGMYRGLTFFYSCINALHDLDDLHKLEMDAAKDAASRSYFINTETGELPDSAARRRERTLITTQKQDGTEVAKARLRDYQQILGGRVAAGKLNEKITQLASARPTPATLELWQHLATQVCDGCGIPYILACPESMQGTVYRGALDAANTFFRSRSAVLAEGFTRVYEYVMRWAKDHDTALAGAPADWFKVSTRAPRAVNVDVGRNSAALIAELAAGTRSYQSWFAENGQDWRTEFAQIDKEISFIKSLKNTPQEITDRLAAVIQAQAPPSE